MSAFNSDFCIVGAGPSGLTAAYKLLKAGKSIVLVERDSRAGGVAKSHNYGGQIFDTGPKRFHTDDPIVLDFITEVVKGHLNKITRSTKVYFLERYFEWPLQSKDLLKMPFTVTARCLLDSCRKRPFADKASFHQYINSKYGETLYALFFKPYTYKFLRWDPEDIHSDWSLTSIDRSVIDKRVAVDNLPALFTALLLPRKIETDFLYPTEGGFGGFYEKLLSLCQDFPDFHLILSDRIVSLSDDGTQFQARSELGKTVIFKDLIWTGNLNEIPVSRDKHMPYLNTIFYNIVCRQEGVGRHNAQWIYVSRGDSLISRITCMKEFASYTCKDGYYNIICELTDSQSRPVYFSNPEKYIALVISELVNMGFITDKRFIEAVHAVPVKDTYPIYHHHYKNDFEQVKAGIKKFSKRIHLLGRCGAFWYNNSDHSIRSAMEMAGQLLDPGKAEFDYRNYFGGFSTGAKQ
ncbi:MAG: FAD-dependent oxidoreductase [Candidatus Omnitrophica bacterium]|nr:FAD-dependent oxidoreductase [Candidatus Omnitrophota bacterium]